MNSGRGHDSQIFHCIRELKVRISNYLGLGLGVLLIWDKTLTGYQYGHGPAGILSYTLLALPRIKLINVDPLLETFANVSYFSEFQIQYCSN